MINLKLISTLSEEQKKSKKELAQFLGITDTSLHKMIRNNSTRIDTLESIAKFFNVPMSYFIEDKEQESDYKALVEFFKKSNEPELYVTYLSHILEQTIVANAGFKNKIKEIFTPNRVIELNLSDDEAMFISELDSSGVENFFEYVYTNLSQEEKDSFKPIIENVKGEFIANAVEDKLFTILKKEKVINEFLVPRAIAVFSENYSFLPKEETTRRKKK